MRIRNRLGLLLALVIAMGICVQLIATPSAARELTDQDLADGFMKTVFGVEYPRWGWQRYYIKKYDQPVSFYVDNRARRQREAAVRRFVKGLGRQIQGLETRIVDDPEKANFRVYIVDRNDYSKIVRHEIYRDRTVQTPGRCLVRVISSTRGITSSDAVIVSDEGEFLFRRCLIEEILQGLGPLNDDETLTDSVFNDRSRHSTFTLHDRYILNILYDRRIKPGMNARDVSPILPEIIEDVRRKVR